MLLKSIHIEGFGCLNNFTTEFQPGLNIIRGPNESGKSTLHQALLMALMAQPTQNQKTIQWRNWNSDQWYRLQMDFLDPDEGTYRITKDFESLSQSVTFPGGDIAKGRDKVERVLAATVGTTSMVIVQSTLCVEQDALAEVANGQREISQSLENILTGSEEHIFTGTALKRLDNHIKDFKKGSGRWAAKPGPLARARDEVDRLKHRAQVIQGQLSAHSNDERELTEVESRLKAIEQELRPLLMTRGQVKRYQEVQGEFSAWQAQEEALDRKIEQVKTAEKTLNETKLKLGALGPLASLSDDSKRDIDQLASRVETLREDHARYEDDIRDYETELAAYRERLVAYTKARADYESEFDAYNQEQQEYQEQLAAYHAAQQEYERLSREYEQWLADHPQRGQRTSSQSGLLWDVLLGGGVLAAAVGLLLRYLGYPPMLGIAGPAVGLLLILAGVWLRTRSADTEQMPIESGDPDSLLDRIEHPIPPAIELPTWPARERPVPTAQLAAPPSKPSYDETPLKTAESQLKQSLTTHGCETIDELNHRYAQVVELRLLMKTTGARLETILSAETLEELERQRRKVSRGRRDAEELLQDQALQQAGAMSLVAINELDNRIQRIVSEQSELQGKQQRLTIKLEQQVVTKEELLQAEETLESAKIAYEQAQERIAVLELTNEILS